MTTETQSADADILANVFGSGRDRGGKSAPPEVALPEQTEAVAEAPPIEAEKPQAGEEAEIIPPDKDAKPRDSNGRFARQVPLRELETERDKRQAAERDREEQARLRVQAEENARNYQRMLDDMERRLKAVQNPPQPPPDPLTEPEQAFNHFANQFETRLLNHNLNVSERFAQREYGKDVVKAAFDAARDAGVLPQFIRHPDPYDEMVNWHKKQLALARVGTDPDAYEKKIREEERQRVLEELKTGALQPASHGRPQPARLPTSLVDATQSGPNGAHPISDAELAKNVFGTDRRRGRG